MCLIVGQISSKLKFCLGFSQRLSSNLQTGSAVVDMIDIVDNDITVKWIMVLLYALSAIILLEGTFEPT